MHGNEVVCIIDSKRKRKEEKIVQVEIWRCL